MKSYRTTNETQTESCDLRIAKMVNKAGKEVAVSAANTQSAVRSRAADILFRSSCQGYGLCADIFDADDEDVWPIVAMSVSPLNMAVCRLFFARRQIYYCSD
jgi:hypothetical protein